MNLFGKKKNQPTTPSEPTEVIKNLRTTLENLDKRELHLQKKIKAQLIEAKEKSLAKDKKGALFALKRKKLYEGETLKINGARMTLEQQIIALEGSTMNYSTFKAMQMGAQAMKGARAGLDVDNVDELIDDIQEEMDISNEIADAISRPANSIYEDEDLADELENLEKEMLDEQILEVPSVPHTYEQKLPEAQQLPAQQLNMPNVPNKDIPTKVSAQAEEDEDEKALRELQADMMA